MHKRGLVEYLDNINSTLIPNNFIIAFNGKLWKTTAVMKDVIALLLENRMLWSFIVLIAFNVLQCGVNSEIFGYRVQNSDLLSVNTIFECSTDASCHSVSGLHNLTAKFVVVNGRAQKQWHISDKFGNNVYGVAELSANPWKLKDWKFVFGPKEAHRYEPQMKMVAMNGSCAIWSDFQSFEWDDDNRIRLAEQLWLLLGSRRFHERLDEKRRVNVVKESQACVALIHKVLSTIDDTAEFNSSSVLKLSVIEHLYTSHAVQLGRRLFQSSLFGSVSISISHLGGVDNPLLCFNYYHQTPVDLDSFYSCMAAFEQYLRGVHQLVEELDPVHLARSIVYPTAPPVTKKVQSFQFLSCLLLGWIQTYSIQKLKQEWRVVAAVRLPSEERIISLRLTVIDCSSLHAYIKNRVDNEAIHNLFMKVCQRFDGFKAIEPLSVSKEDALSTSVSILFSLLDIGAVNLASLHVRNLILSQLGQGLDFDEPQLSPRWLSRYVIPESSNIRGAVRLLNLLESLSVDNHLMGQFTSNGELMSAFLNVIFQVCSPVVLEAGHQWASEAIALRDILVESLNLLTTQCSTRRCIVADPFVVGRGLFLLAYQGIAVSSEQLSDVTRVDSSVLHDSVVPTKYNQLMKLVDQHFPWSYSSNDSSESWTDTSTRRKVGFLSFFLTRHSVGRLLAKIIAQISEIGDLDVYIITKQYSPSGAGGGAADDVTLFLQNAVPSARWIVISKDIPTAVAKVRDLNLDVLVFGDAFMESFIAYLAMFRMARTQVIFWGHPFTTGYVESMDYFITSDSFEPTTSALSRRDRQFSEQLIRMDSLSFQMFPAEEMTVTVGSVLPFSASGVWSDVLTPTLMHQDRLAYLRWILTSATDIHGVTVDPENLLGRFRSLSESEEVLLSSVRVYGALQSLFKMHPLFDEALIEILRTDPFALVLLSDTRRQSVWQAVLRERLLRRLSEKEEKSNAEYLAMRVLFIPQMKHSHYSLLLCGVDVSLDPFPFGGGVTLCDAVGRTCPSPVPFVSSGQLQSVHRIGAGMAKHFNNSQLAFSTPESSDMKAYVSSYVVAAVKMANESLKRKLKGSEPLKDTDIISELIYDDTAAAREWNDLLLRLASN